MSLAAVGTLARGPRCVARLWLPSLCEPSLRCSPRVASCPLALEVLERRDKLIRIRDALEHCKLGGLHALGSPSVDWSRLRLVDLVNSTLRLLYVHDSGRLRDDRVPELGEAHVGVSLLPEKVELHALRQHAEEIVFHL